MLDGNVLLRQKRDEVPEGTLSCPDRNMEFFYHYRHYEGLRLLPSACEQINNSAGLKYDAILRIVDDVVVLSERYYNGCLLRRNDYMVNGSISAATAERL